MPAPIPYSEEIADRICDAVATSPCGISAIIKDLDLQIAPSTFYRWLQANPTLCERYARARSEQAQLLADQIKEIADKEPEYCEIPVKNGSYQAVDRGHLEWRRLQVDARKWLASKLLPKVYGDKLAHTGPDGEGPAVFVLERIGKKDQQ